MGLSGTSVAGSPVCDCDPEVPDADGSCRCRVAVVCGSVDGAADSMAANCSSAVSGGSPSAAFDVVDAGLRNHRLAVIAEQHVLRVLV